MIVRLNKLLCDYYKIAEFRAPPDSASEEHGITTIGDYGLLHSGYFIETSNETAKGGFFVSPEGSQIISCWSVLTGDKAGTYQLIYSHSGNSVPKILSEGKGTIEFHPKFSPDGNSIFVIFKVVDNLNDLIVYREGKNPITLLSGAEEIYYNFTYEGDSAVVYYKTTHKNEGEIFLLDLDIMSITKISDGDNPYITNLFSIDGKPWE